MMFIKYAAVHLQQLGLKKQMPDLPLPIEGEKKDLPSIKSQPEDANKGETLLINIFDFDSYSIGLN